MKKELHLMEYKNYIKWVMNYSENGGALHRIDTPGPDLFSLLLLIIKKNISLEYGGNVRIKRVIL